MAPVEERPLAALLGKGASFEGELSFDGRVRLDGTWTGTLRCTDTVEVGASGVVIGALEAREVILAGRLEGRLIVRHRLVIEPSGRVEGELEALELEVRPGASLHAQVRSGSARAKGADT